MTLGIFLNLASLLSLGDNVSESHCIFFFSFSHSLLWILKNIFRITGSCSKFGCVLGRQSYLLVPFLIKKKSLHLNLVRRKYPKLGPFPRERKKKSSFFNIINMPSQMKIVHVI